MAKQFVNMKMQGIIVLGFLLSCLQVFSQGELDEQQKIFYRNEKSIGLLLNSNGLGINLSYAKRMNARKKVLYTLDFVGIKHPKEVKISSTDLSFETAGSYVYGKLNKFYNLRTGIGLQNEMFRKLDRGGISIRNFYAGGIDLGFKKPIYYLVYDYNNNLDVPAYERRVRKFDTSPHASNIIIKNASFFKGFDEIGVVPGIFGKFGFTFEYSKLDEVIHAIEAGVIIDAFPQKIPIMATEDNNFLFFTMFISYRFGKVVNAQFSNKKTKIDRIILDE